MLSSVLKAVTLLAFVAPFLAEDLYYPSNPQQYPPVDPYPKESPVYPPAPISNTYRRPSPASYDGGYRQEPLKDASAVQLGLKGPGQGVPCSPGSKYKCPWILQCQCKDCSGHGGCKHYCC